MNMEVTQPVRHAGARYALVIEAVLIAVAASGIVGLFVFLALSPNLLSPDESVELVRARVIRGTTLLLIPLAVAVIIPLARTRMSSLFAGDIKAARFAWIAMIAVTIALMGFSGTAVWGTIAELDFRTQ